MFNRPISPHITIYSPQLSSLSSIWHRIAGVLLIFFLNCTLIILQFILSVGCIKFLDFTYTFLNLKYWWILFLFLFIYHLLSGLKHVIWDLGFFLSEYNLKLWATIISSSIILSFLNNL